MGRRNKNFRFFEEKSKNVLHKFGTVDDDEKGRKFFRTFDERKSAPIIRTADFSAIPRYKVKSMRNENQKIKNLDVRSVFPWDFCKGGWGWSKCAKFCVIS